MSDSSTTWLENLDPETDMLYVTMEDGTFDVIDLVVSTRAKAGAFVRDGGSWFRIPDKDDDTLNDVVVMEVSPDFVELFDRRQEQNKKITLDEVRGFTSDGSMTAAAAPKKDRIKGSDKNKPGSASGNKKIVFSDKVETALKNKVKDHNEKASDGRKATLGQLKAVYRRGAGAFSSSHRPGMARDQWAMARVNAYLKLLKSGKPSNPKYKQDNDLLPASHPRSTKKSAAITASGLVPEEQALAEALVWITSKYGKFDQDGDGVWAGYTPAQYNDVKDIGVKCSNCVFYQGTTCQIISLQVEAEGKCRFAVIPEGVVDGSAPAPRSKEATESLIADTYADTQLFADLEPEDNFAIEEDECPPATQDIAVNLANRENAIKTAGYGPLNPAEPNEEFWKEKGDRWSVTIDDAKKSLCGNCAVFVVTSKMRDCIAGGLEQGGSSEGNAWDAIDAAELGYCESFDFKCAASRTCDAWVAGGPIADNV